MYWLHVLSLDDSRLLKKVYLVTSSSEKKESWTSLIHRLLVSYGIGHLWGQEHLIYNLDGKGNLEAKNISDHQRFWKRYIKGKIFEHEQKKWWENMNFDVENRKLRTYVTFKKSLRFEKYLLVDSDYLGRSLHTSLRTGTNVLEIEQGRYKRVPREQRFCQLCRTGEVEDERHFVLECPLYQLHRDDFYYSVKELSEGKWKLDSRPKRETFLLLMAGTGDQFEKMVFRQFHSFLIKCFKLRKSMVEN